MDETVLELGLVRRAVSAAATRGPLHQVKARPTAQGWESPADRSRKRTRRVRRLVRGESVL